MSAAMMIPSQFAISSSVSTFFAPPEPFVSTAVGMEVAIPHAKSEAVKAPALTAITVPDGVDYDSPDGKPCKLLFMIAATTDGDVHLEVLARLMQLLMHEDFTAKLKAAKTPEEFISIIDARETEKFPDEPKAEVPAKKGYRVLCTARTVCFNLNRNVKAVAGFLE